MRREHEDYGMKAAGDCHRGKEKKKDTTEAATPAIKKINSFQPQTNVAKSGSMKV